jgi:hypothetical protein
MNRRSLFVLAAAVFGLAILPRRLAAAVLSDQDRQRVANGLMRYWSREHTEIDITKDRVRVFVDETDDWIDQNQGAYNASLPTDIRNALALSDKTLGFCGVAAMRVSPAFCRLLFGELD